MGIVYMAYGKVGRPREEGDRYPSGKLKPSAPAGDSGRTPISGALWQRMLTDGERIFGDARFGTELGRLSAIGSLTPSEVATGFRVAGIYGRFEYYKNLKRSAASPHYIREFITEGSDTELINFTVKEGRERDRSFNLDDRELREQEASAAFKALQEILPREFRADVEMLCVENRHVGYQGLQRARVGLAIVKEHFSEQEPTASKKDRKALRRRRTALEPAPPPKPASENPLKSAFFAVRRKRSPTLSDTDLEQEWNVLCALKARSDFRREKSAGGSM